MKERYKERQRKSEKARDRKIREKAERRQINGKRREKEIQRDKER